MVAGRYHGTEVLAMNDGDSSSVRLGTDPLDGTASQTIGGSLAPADPILRVSIVEWLRTTHLMTDAPTSILRLSVNGCAPSSRPTHSSPIPSHPSRAPLSAQRAGERSRQSVGDPGIARHGRGKQVHTPINAAGKPRCPARR